MNIQEEREAAHAWMRQQIAGLRETEDFAVTSELNDFGKAHTMDFSVDRAAHVMTVEISTHYIDEGQLVAEHDNTLVEFVLDQPNWATPARKLAEQFVSQWEASYKPLARLWAPPAA